jgi:hypothetical protein
LIASWAPAGRAIDAKVTSPARTPEAILDFLGIVIA